MNEPQYCVFLLRIKMLVMLRYGNKNKICSSFVPHYQLGAWFPPSIVSHSSEAMSKSGDGFLVMLFHFLREESSQVLNTGSFEAKILFQYRKFEAKTSHHSSSAPIQPNVRASSFSTRVEARCHGWMSLPSSALFA